MKTHDPPTPHLPAPVPRGPARALGQRLGQAEPRPAAPPRGCREGAGSEADYKPALEPQPAACEKHFPSIYLIPWTKHLTPGRGRLGCLAPATAPGRAQLPASRGLPGRRRETKRQRARRTTLPRGMEARAGGRRAPGSSWLAGRAASLYHSSLWWPGLGPRTSADARGSGASPLFTDRVYGGQTPSGRLSC